MTEEENKMIRDLHRFFMEPEVPGKKTRAQQIDDLLTIWESGGVVGRVILWLSGMAGAIAVLYTFFQGVNRP